MDLKNINEAEELIGKFRKVMAAKAKIEEINGEYGGKTESFVLVDKDTGINICLHNLKAEALDGIDSALNDQYDKIVARLKEM